MYTDPMTPEERAICELQRRCAREYGRLARAGLCDSPGSVEYHRVMGEWARAGWPGPVAAFIRHRANIGPAGE